MSKLNLEMTLMEAGVALAEGNPGAMKVLAHLIVVGDEIDPVGSIGGLGPLMLLDSYEIYGSKIWMLFKDVCGEDIRTTYWMLRAVQLGILSESSLKAAINGEEELDIDDIMSQVEQTLQQI